MRTFTLVHAKARETLKKVIDGIPLDGKMKVEIKKVSSKRSDAQNNMYHMWVDIIAGELGYTHNEMHELLVQELLIPTHKTVLDKMVTIWPSTKTLKVHEFSKFLNDVEVFATSGQGIRLPHPADYGLAHGERKLYGKHKAAATEAS